MRYLFCFALLSILFFTQCNDANTIGLDIDDDEQLSAQSTDTVSVDLRTIAIEPQVIYDSANTGFNVVLGQLNDAIYGSTKSSMYVQLRMLSPLDGNEQIQLVKVDSVILGLEYNEDICYGNYREDEFNVAVHSIEGNDFNRLAVYKTDQEFNINEDPLGTLQNYKPNYDSLRPFYFYANDSINERDTITLPPHMKISLSNAFGEQILNLDSNILRDNDLFVDEVKGLFLDVQAMNSMIGFNLRGRSSRITIYYTREEEKRDEFQLFINNLSPIVMNYKHDISGSRLEQSINQGGEDSITFIQGLAGAETVIDLSGIESKLEGELVFAECEITVANDMFSIDENLNPVPSDLIAVYETTDSVIFPIGDVVVNPAVFSDGVVEKRLELGKIIKKYRFRITNQVRDYIDGVVGPEIRLRPNQGILQANRTTLFSDNGSREVKLILGTIKT